MTADAPLHAQRDRADSFGSVAAAYDRYRPRYPDAVVDEIAALAAGGPVLDVGAGTGLLAEPLLRRGVDVLAVEPDPEMAEIARAKGIVVEEATAETWEPAGRRFSLVTFANSWHWVDVDVVLPILRDVLVDGGHLVLLWHATAPTGPSKDRIDAAYADSGMQGVVGPSATPSITDQLTSAGWEVTDHTFTGESLQRADDWLDTAFTYSNHIVLDAGAAQRLRSRLADAIGPDGITVTAFTYWIEAHPA
ncbi:class I SAM-dependent methyltransferase [Williamsia deligens]|uniref:Class I SAM-dependent methyltransferase n=1 Tax=Williamsia deligens TaxID=321325 RepID=A0ABW3G7P4_9NOCA|nr:class I SAM-dependent methyltransferase [Williamsia deligens]MCP2194338.1 Methyltransferase domain-containing protein [Williamsia deligens]